MMSLCMESLFVREYELNCGLVLQINQCEVGDVGGVVWDAALLLSSYIQKLNLSDKEVIELGAGTGIVGLVAASLRAKVTLTDLDDVLPLISYNIQKNKEIVGDNAQCKSLLWGNSFQNDTDKADYILMADCIYYEESLEPLVTTLRKMSSSSTIVLCCYEQRTEGRNPQIEAQFLKLVKNSFEIFEISQDALDPQFRCDDIKLLQFTKTNTV